jgi:hypothetical protein
MAVGACAYAFGLFAGASVPRFKVARRPFFNFQYLGHAADYVVRQTVWIVGASVIGLYLSFLIMGYVPMFADDPLQAKYFHEQYRAGYLRAVWIYLPSFSAFAAYVPMFMLVMWRRRAVRYLPVLLGGIAAFLLTLHRGELGGPLIIGVGLILVQSKFRGAIPLFLVVCLLAWSFGSIANYLLAMYFDIRVAKIGNEPITLWNLVANGAPDVMDNLNLLQRFADTRDYTWARNWLGGLIPNQSQWNPGIWSLAVALEMSREEAINFAGGGLRVAIPITFCDWPGVVVFSLLIGLLTGYVVRFAARITEGNVPEEVKALAVLVATAVISNLDAPTWHTLLPLLMLLALLHPVRLRLGACRTCAEQSFLAAHTLS